MDECLLKELSDCPLSSKIFFRTQGFSLFVSGELIMRNLIIDGADMNLFQECQQPIINNSCCTRDTMGLDFAFSPCGLTNKPFFSKPLDSFSIISALFSLLTQDDLDNNNSYHRIPTISLDKVEFANLYLLQNESGWQVLIKTSILPSRILIKNCVFINN
jgi:hypothetical protein